MNQCRTEYPNPQFERKNWQSLNGEWDFGFKKAARGFKFSANDQTAVDIYYKNIYTHKINVPFALKASCRA